MRRLFWVGVGVAATVVVYRKGRKVVRQYLPSSVAERAEKAAHDAGERATGFLAEFRETFGEARARREAELTAALLAEGQQDPATTRAARATGARRPSPAGGPAADVDPFDGDEAELGYSF
ncbi:hypothetical protein [Xylanimonas protaetiae]|uniref:Uncharacterized protein n=1 Tax=Xylanimonas protaetiae TaxID=2509457 RepID=A0A4P6FC48_9MICO|nr:hypothetical protein [Xylanimonas protaetiae]QAY71107.1 hypothetical protein ET471_14570 [Xylanimonas protaetiae]